MTPIAIAAAVLMLLAASLPGPREGRLGPGLLVLLLTVVGGAALVKVVLARTNYVSSSPSSQLLKYALRELAATDEPNVLLVDGGSYVQRGLDGELLERELAQLGYRDHYLTPSNGWFALVADHGGGDTLPLDWRGHLAVVRHALINGFNVGLIERLTKLDDVAPWRPKISREPRRRFDFEGMSSLVAETGRAAQAQRLAPWLLPIRDRRLRGVWKPFIDEWVYFALPSTTLAQLDHARAFCLQTANPCIAPDDAALLGSLDDAQFWFDAGHLSAKGSRVYTRWLAEQIAKRGVLEK